MKGGDRSPSPEPSELPMDARIEARFRELDDAVRYLASRVAYLERKPK